MPYSCTSAAAVSSCVDSGLLAHSASSAPPACSARMRLAVSVVTCMQAAIRTPSNGRSFSNRSRIWRSTGIERSAHSMRALPCAARDGSAMSWRGRS